MISTAQIEYMLERMYSEHKLTIDIEQQRLRFTLFEWQQQAVGFTGCEIQAAHLFLDKIYLQVAYHGQGFGQQMLHYVEQLGREQDLISISLRVNKHNIQAIRAYERAGFANIKSLCTDIGQGFVMDDYVMQKSLI